MKSFYYAFSGIVYAFKSEFNMRIHVIATLLVTIAGFYFRLSTVEWALVVFCFCSVISMELINTAVEKIGDHVTIEHHPAIKIIKDVAAAAVLVTATGSSIVGLIIFIPKIFSLFNL